MLIYNPARILHGSALHTLLDEAAVNPRLGGHALLVTNSQLVRDGTIQMIREDLESEGMESILFDGADESSAVNAVREAVALASGGRTGFVVGVGPPITLDIAKIVSVAAGSDRDIYQLLGGVRDRMTGDQLPFLAVPTRCWNPLLFSDKAAIVDSRDNTPKLVDIGNFPDAVFFLTELPDALTEKQSLYDLLCIFGGCMESTHLIRRSVGYPLDLYPIKKAVSMLRSIPTSDTRPDRAAIQIAGIHSSWVEAQPGIGFVLGRCANAVSGVAPEWVSTALLPAVTGYHLRRNSRQIPELLNALDLEPADSREAEAEAIESEVRSLTGLADVPLRLCDLGIDQDALPGIAGAAAGMCRVDGDTLQEIIRAAL